MGYAATCHCGAVEVDIEGDVPSEAISCNCSHCRRKGFLLTFVPAERATLTRGEDQLETYTFNKHVIRHRFCRTCGAQPLAEGKGPDGAETIMVNLRCVEAVDLDALKINKYDGASH